VSAAKTQVPGKVQARKVRPRGLSEIQESIDLVRWMDRKGLLFTHVPMGGLRDKRGAAILEAMGVRRGCPDYLVFTPPPPGIHGGLSDGHGGTLRVWARGVAIELKKAFGGRLRASQAKWRDALTAAGWVCIVAHGAKDAIAQLSHLFPENHHVQG
jgi:hypothetical protein